MPDFKLIDYHQPAGSGYYTVTVTQTVDSTLEKQPPSTRQHFLVTGEQLVLKSTDIVAVFPPDGSIGDHSTVLPHLILKRSTLPWERSATGKPDNSNGSKVQAYPKDVNLPWLALLLFDETEVAQFKRAAPAGMAGASSPEWQVIPTSQLAGDGTVKFPAGYNIDPGQAEASVTVIDVPKHVLMQLLPDTDTLKLLSHVRQGTTGEEWAVVIADRLPAPKAISTMHLVSVEQRYSADGTFDFQGAADADFIRLISLKSWRFVCTADKQKAFEFLLNNLTTGTLQLPIQTAAVLDSKRKQGYVPVPYHLRDGSQTISWYHGPCVTGENTGSFNLPVAGADQLRRIAPDTGILDFSYAAAWELGRLLALQSKKFSHGLNQWRRTVAQHSFAIDSVSASDLNQADKQLVPPSLRAAFAQNHQPLPQSASLIVEQANFSWTVRDSNNANAILYRILASPGSERLLALPDLPTDVGAWLKELSQLKGIPFSYLVPDERILPMEAIRFFWLDKGWLAYLLDGAFSLGRVTSADYARDAYLIWFVTSLLTPQTGLLLRSDVVNNWPAILVDGYPDQTGKIPLNTLRLDRLSAHVILGLFEGQVQTVDIHQKPEMLHFGVSESYTPSPDRVIDVINLSTSYNANSAAQFALKMIQPPVKIRFSLE